MRWSRLLIVFLAFWLPTSVVAATNMSASMSAPMLLGAADDAEVCPQHAPPAGERDPASCYSCSFCQFACTAMMTLEVQSFDFSAAWIEALSPLPTASPYVSDRLQRPPLTL